MSDQLVEAIRKEAEENALIECFANHEKQVGAWQIGTLQVVAYVAVGGGMLGKLYAESPAVAYIDMRVGKLPYSRKQIENIRRTLVAMAKAHGLDPKHLPKYPSFHNCGVF